MLELKGNPNYAAFIYEVTQTHPLDGDDTVRGACVQRARPLVLVEVAVGGVQVMHIVASEEKMEMKIITL